MSGLRVGQFGEGSGTRVVGLDVLGAPVGGVSLLLSERTGDVVEGCMSLASGWV